MNESTIRLVIADDHALVTDGILARLSKRPEFEICAVVSNGNAALSACVQHQPDVVLLDVGLPAMDGLEAAQAIKRAVPDIYIIIITGTDDHNKIIEIIRLGASACLYKGTQFNLAETIHNVLNNYVVMPDFILKALFDDPTLGVNGHQQALTQVSFTEQEQMILFELVNGHSNKEICLHLDIAMGTVKTHLTNIYRKLNVRSRSEVVRVVLEHNLIDLAAGEA